MDTEKLLAVADHLETVDDEDFDMGVDHFCICGHLTRLYPELGSSHLLNYIAYKLGVNDELFLPNDDTGAYGFTGAQAAKVIRHYVETGILDWSVGVNQNDES